MSLRQEVVRSWMLAVFVIFAIPGVAYASWVSRVPQIRDSLQASASEIGFILFGLAAGSVCGLLTSSHVLSYFGGRVTIFGAVIATVIGLAVAGLGATLVQAAVVFCGAFVSGAGFGIGDVAMNVEGTSVERHQKRTILSWFHASYSFGTVIGAMLGAAAEAVKLPVVVHFSCVAVAIVVVLLIVIRFVPKSELPDENTPPQSVSNRLAVWLEPRTLLLGLLVLGMAFSEGAANDWLALALVDGYGLENAAGSLGFGVFVVAMTIGRLGGPPLTDRFGRVTVLRLSAILAASGLAGLIFAGSLVPAMIGLVCWGLGSSLGFPVGISAAADDPAKAAARVSVVATLGYLAFLSGPPLLGLLGDQVGILRALVVVLVLVLLAGILSPAARPLSIEPSAGTPPTVG